MDKPACQHIPFAQTGLFSDAFLDYIQQEEKLKPFYGHFPSLENFEKQIHQKANFGESKRKVLHQSLQSQYQSIAHPPQAQLDSLLQPNTFTVTTGHQLNIFSGPLYFHYKIMTVIKLAEQLKERYPAYHFVPVYWMASEDHDFEEISHFRLFGRRFQWNTEQKGAVGRFSNAGLDAILEEVKEDCEPFATAYKTQKNLADATRAYVHALYGEKGLVVVDADEPALKKQLSGVIQDDLLFHDANALVEKTSKKLEDLGYKAQVFPRKINFFYLDKNIRERIVRHEHQDEYVVLNTRLKFGKEEIRALAENQPEKFSPNVVLRPLYQEVILPNLSYTGGPSELIYWLQLKDVFAHFNVPFPILLPRNFVLYFSDFVLKKLEKLGLNASDLLKDKHQLKMEYIQEKAAVPITLESETSEIQAIFEKIAAKGSEIDASLAGYILGEEKKLQKTLDKIAQRLKKTEERKHETAIKQLEGLKDKLFPGGSPQERKDNILNFYLNDKDFLAKIYQALQPFRFEMHLVT